MNDTNTNEVKELNETEQAVIEMLRESTGTHFLDSGGAYGRHWEKNKEVDFPNTPSCEVDIWGEGDISITFNVYHFLTTYCELDKAMTDEMLKLGEDLPEHNSWFDIADNYLDVLALRHDQFESFGKVNTYNGECMLSQTLIYTLFTLTEDEFDVYVMLHVHNGCDVRGGYTSPKIFKVEERDYFILGMVDCNAYCEKCGAGWHSDNCGYSWYADNEEGKFKHVVEFNEDTKELTHKQGECGGKIGFGVRDCY